LSFTPDSAAAGGARRAAAAAPAPATPSPPLPPAPTLHREGLSREQLAALRGGADDMRSKVWYYADPEGVTRGPFNMYRLLEWLDELRRDPKYAEPYRDFLRARMWRAGMGHTVPLSHLASL